MVTLVTFGFSDYSFPSITPPFRKLENRLRTETPAGCFAVLPRATKPQAFRRGTSRLVVPRARPLASGIVLLLAAVAAVPAVAAEAGDPIRLRGVLYLGDLPTQVADARELFARHGLSVEVDYEETGRESLQALRAGETDFALMSLTPLVLDRLAHPGPDGGDDPVILTNLVHSTGLKRVVTLADNGIETAADLAGRRVGLARGMNTEFLWWQFAIYHRLDPASVELLELPIEEVPAALDERRIDAAVVWEPWVIRMEQQAGEPLRLLAGSSIYSARWVLVTTRRMARERPDLCRTLLAVYREAIDVIERHPQESLQSYVDRAGIPREGVERLREEMLYGLGLDWSLIGGLRQQAQWAVDAGHVAVDAEPRLLSWIDAGPLRSLVPTAVGLPQPVRQGQRP